MRHCARCKRSVSPVTEMSAAMKLEESCPHCQMPLLDPESQGEEQSPPAVPQNAPLQREGNVLALVRRGAPAGPVTVVDAADPYASVFARRAQLRDELKDISAKRAELRLLERACASIEKIKPRGA